MPAQTYYLDTDHLAYLDAEADRRSECDNPSQALRQILEEHREASDD